MGDLFRLLKEEGKEASELTLAPQNLAKLIGLIDKGVINRNTAKTVFEAMFKTGVDPEVYVKEQGLEMVSDQGAVAAVIAQVLKDNPQSVADFQGGKEKAFGFLVGQCMKALKGKANPKVVNETLRAALTKD